MSFSERHIDSGAACCRSLLYNSHNSHILDTKIRLDSLCRCILVVVSWFWSGTVAPGTTCADERGSNENGNFWSQTSGVQPPKNPEITFF